MIMELPIIENAYYIVRQYSSNPTFWGMPIPLATTLVSVGVTLIVFGIGHLAQYYTNRRRDIKKLISYKNSLSIIIDELIFVTRSQSASLNIFTENVKLMTNFNNPILTGEPNRKNLLDIIDKKDVMYIISRWCKNGNAQMLNFFKLVTHAENIVSVMDQLVKLHDTNMIPELTMLMKEWNENSKVLGQIFENISPNNKDSNLNQAQWKFIVDRYNAYLIKMSQSTPLQLNVLEYHDIFLQPVLGNDELNKVFKNSQNPDARLFWETLKRLMHVHDSFLEGRKKYYEYFKRYEGSLTVYARVELPEIKTKLSSIKELNFWKLA